ncbi:MAG TPA: sigma-54 dependent transcriptional regulator [Verrucomicrobiota bacterium]|nr:sigma-54 dependent transcriptional regulator [Verrucomicrobiota bacterium]
MSSTAVSPARILIVDDVAANRDLLRQTLEPAGCEILLALNGEMALRVAAKAQPDVILLDVMMPGMDGFEACRRLKADDATRAIPVLFITAQHEVGSLVEGFRAGGVDYITKPFQPDEVRARVTTHLQLNCLARALTAKNAELTAANLQLRTEMARRERAETVLAETDARLSLLTEREAERWGIAGFVGRSPALAKVVENIRMLQPLTTSVLITGESGTGKELVARALHFGGPRAQAPFIAINCAAINKEMAESELFGHRKGSFTGATADKKGAFELAHGGTLFLDEMGDLPEPLQAKLLRVLETGGIWSLGAQAERTVDVRLIAATNADLDQAMAERRFRTDLFYRLERFTISLPPLRERRDDIPALAAHFAAQFAAEMGRAIPALTETAITVLQTHSWPGNVRELRNVMERALISSRGQPVDASHVAIKTQASGPALASSPRISPDVEREFPLNLEEAEAVLIRRALAAGGGVAEAARLMGVDRGWIYRRLAKRSE